MERQLPALAALPFPELERPYELVSLSHASEYPFCEGRVVSTAGIDVPMADYESVFEEHQVARARELAASTHRAVADDPVAVADDARVASEVEGRPLALQIALREGAAAIQRRLDRHHGNA